MSSVEPAEGMEGLAATITEGYQTLRHVTCLEDVYDIMDFLLAEVQDKYDKIRCKIDCATCCKGLHPPFITALEWELILYYITEFPQVVQDEIVRRARFYAAEYRESLLLQQQLINGEIPAERVRETYQSLAQSLKSASCPFLVMDKCGVYPVRPAKCRAMGNTLVQINDEVKVHTCAWEMSSFEEQMNKSGNRALTMPVWNIFEQVIKILNPEDAMKTVIPIWLITHVSGNEILDTINPNPKVTI